MVEEFLEKDTLLRLRWPKEKWPVEAQFQLIEEERGNETEIFEMLCLYTFLASQQERAKWPLPANEIVFKYGIWCVKTHDSMHPHCLVFTDPDPKAMI